MSEQPTIEELNAAWTRAIECADIPGARAESMGELKRLRNLKTTWVGREENDLRFALIRYLGENASDCHSA